MQSIGVLLIMGGLLCSTTDAVRVRSLPLDTRSVPLVSLLEVTHTQLRQQSALTYF